MYKNFKSASYINISNKINIKLIPLMSKLVVLQEASLEMQVGILFAILSWLEFSCKH